MGNFDVGFKFGAAGIGHGDWLHSVTFDIAPNLISGLNLYRFMPIHMQNFIAARVMSLPNGGSSKLSDWGTNVAELSAILGLLALAVGGLSGWGPSLAQTLLFIK